MKYMSFWITTQQMFDRTKWVTRRNGWGKLLPNQIVMAVVRCRGLKKGQKIQPIYPIQIISTRWEPLEAITADDVVAEGFPGMMTEWYIQMYINSHKRNNVTRKTLVNRIEFKEAILLPGDVTWAIPLPEAKSTEKPS